MVESWAPRSDLGRLDKLSRPLRVFVPLQRGDLRSPYFLHRGVAIFADNANK